MPSAGLAPENTALFSSADNQFAVSWEPLSISRATGNIKPNNGDQPMIHTRTDTQALRNHKARPARKIPGLRERLMDDRVVASMTRTDFMGLGGLR
jgi:hypothetical protein